MAPHEYLFVNKDLSSPSLSRNTGCEASLASQVNKHVQQQRFWSKNTPRKNWYRPFRRDNSSGPTSPSGSSTSDDHQFEYMIPQGIEPKPKPKRRSTPRSETRIIKKPNDQVKRQSASPVMPTIISFEVSPMSNRLSDSPDAFNPISPRIPDLLRRVIDGYMSWATRSSVTEQTVKEGTKWVYQNILINPMHAMAFLAAATAHERKTANFVLPIDQEPEFFSIKGTQLVREHLASNSTDISDYVFVDIYRLGLCEWLNGRNVAARIHFAEIARQYGKYKAKTPIDRHHIEIITTADLFLAMDVDSHALMPLTWEPELPIAPYERTTPFNSLYEACSARHGNNILDFLARTQPRIFSIMERCFREWTLFPDAISIDYASPVTGPIWAMKRRMQGTMTRLQEVNSTGFDDCVRRSLVIVLFLATTHAARRSGRTNVALLARRLKTAIYHVDHQSRSASVSTNTSPGMISTPDSQSYDEHQFQHPRSQYQSRSQSYPQYRSQPHHFEGEHSNDEDPSIWLWIYFTGLAAALEAPIDTEILEWFSQKAENLALTVYGSLEPQRILIGLVPYLMFKRVHASAVMYLVKREGNQMLRLGYGSRSNSGSSESSPENWEGISPDMVQNYQTNYSRDMRA